MFKLSVESHRYSTAYVTYKCPECNMEHMKVFYWDTPQRNLHGRCWSCNAPQVDHETLIRQRLARVAYHFTGDIPRVAGSTFVV